MRKKTIATILSILLVFCNVHFLNALVTYNCTGLTGGASRDLDYLSVNDLSEGDRAIVIESSGVTSSYYYFVYEASSTTAEETGTHPYIVRPDDYATGGVWVEASVNWVAMGSDVTVNNLTVNNTLTTNNVNASGQMTGGVYFTTVNNSNYGTLSGQTLYGGFIAGVSPCSNSSVAHHAGVTIEVPTATGNGENFIVYSSGTSTSILPLDTASALAGGTVFVKFTSGDTIISSAPVVAGVSHYVLSGDATEERIYVFSTQANYWTVFTSGSVRTERTVP